MLNLKRRVDESIILHTSDGPVTITVCGIQRGYGVYLGIQAPLSVRVVRSELEELVTAAKKVLT